ncbi:protein-L-isoaspartate(D-aspartate) O-methyltransferase [Desulfuromonas versatilis]|nr:protein-L-isoaspartate(D-aspartate) O-methyltransferase [Desulfuromonas versatilis]
MLATIEAETRLTSRQTGRSALRERVMEALAKVPREEFVPGPMRPFAYADNALPIGLGQTISQPFIVALMTDLLEPEKDHRVLEIGTGSGYQAAVLSQLVRKVYSVEVIPELAEQASRRLQRLGYRNVEVRLGDGNHGWPEHAPFEGVMVTAAAPLVPPALKKQLASRGRLVIPIGLPYLHQELMVLEKDEAGNISTREVLGVAFVPLVGGVDPAERRG